MSTSLKRSEKQLPIKANVSSFLHLNCSNFRLNCVKGLKIVKQIKHGEVWPE